MLTMGTVTHSYRRGPTALDGLSGELSGPRVAVLGPNGAGKSTLLGLVATSLALQSGSLVVVGYDLTDRTDRRRHRHRLGVMPQSMGLPAGYTCREFLRYVAWMREVAPSEVDAAAEEALAAVDLQARADTRISTLSGGMRQRLGLAQALVNDPALVVLDEPTVGLDPRQRSELRDYLRRLDRPLVIATHLVDDVAALADDVLVIDEGRAVFAGPLVEFCAGLTPTAETVEQAYLALVPAGDRP